MEVTKVKALNKDMVDYPFFTIVIEDGEDSCTKLAVAAELHSDEGGPDATGGWIVMGQGEAGTYTAKIFKDEYEQWVSDSFYVQKELLAKIVEVLEKEKVVETA